MSGETLPNGVRCIANRKNTWVLRKMISGHRYEKWFRHVPTQKEIADAISEFKILALKGVCYVEQLQSGSYRLTKMIKGVRYKTTVKEVPDKTEYERILQDLIAKKPKRRSWGKALTKKQTFVYFIENSENLKIKIGLSTDVSTRIRDLKTACGAELKLIGTLEHKHLEDAFAAEHDLHKRFENQRIYVNGTSTEWFNGSIKSQVLKILEAAS